VPKQNSSGGKARQVGISKQGDRYLRRLLVLGATAVIRHARTRTTAEAAWLKSLLERRPARLASIAQAVARQPGWPVVLPHPKMLPRRRELSQPNAPWFLSPLAAAKPARVTDDARSDVPISGMADPPVGAGKRVRWPSSLRP